jgi:hypothetical protein
MFGDSRRGLTALIVAGVLAVLIVFGILIWSLFSEGTANREAYITTSTQTSVYVDPAKCPLCQTAGTTGNGGVSGDVTPNVTGNGSTGAAPAPSGGFFSGFFSGTPKDLPTGYTVKNLSNQFRMVRISSATHSKTAQVGTADTVSLKENIGSSDSPVNITGWKVVSNSGSYTIQRAAKTYKTSGAGLTNVTLANGQSANIYATNSAVNANFMGNTCMGYLSSQYSFVPKLSGSCVKPTKNEIATFSGACQDYILKLKTCQAGDANDSRIPSTDSACRTFVANINYDGCVKTHQADTNFYTNVWNIWAGKSFLDPLHDRILLLDANGKLVDYYLY